MKKEYTKGYTLVELIAVMVVLGIAGIITLIVTLSTINSYRYENAKASAFEVISSIKLYRHEKLISNNGVIDDLNILCDKKCKYLEDEIQLSTNPSSGKINVSSDGTITGEISFYDGDYVFYICNGNLFDEKISTCLTSNSLTLEKKDYKEGSEVLYAGFLWNVIKDNGDNTTLILKSTINYASLGNKKYNYEESDVNKKLTEWFNNNLTLKSASEQEKLVLMKFNDGNKDYETFVRIPSKDDIGIKKSTDKCNKSWCNIKSGYWLIDYVKSNEGIYKVYNIGEDGGTYTIDVSNESGIRPVITVKEH